MEIQILGAGAFSSALVKLKPGEQLVSEAGAFFRGSSNVDIDVSTYAKSKKSGGLSAGLKRALAQESFFLSKYTCNDANDGEVGLAPKMQGEIAVIDCDGSSGWLCTGGSYLASTSGLEIDTQFQGLKGFLTGESLSFISVTGQGQLLVNAFGHINQIEVDGALTVDTGHVVAFQDTLDYKLGKAASSWLHSFLTSERVVLKFKGTGKIYLQGYNPDEFGHSLGPLLPYRK